MIIQFQLNIPTALVQDMIMKIKSVCGGGKALVYQPSN